MSSVNGSSWLRQGQKVVCIDDADNSLGLARKNGLRNGTVYTIDRIEMDGECPHLWVTGITSGSWCHKRFRPATAAKTEQEDIALFLSIANEAEKPLVNLTDALNRSFLAVSDWEE